ncbi:MAG: hypothetical protein QOF00_6492, partial [Pseudonocardiales bacterium]|nr:hypothetical protein [Pseudonocardiales bacterium]
EPICRVLQVAPSTCYAAETRPPSARARQGAELLPQPFTLREPWKTGEDVELGNLPTLQRLRRPEPQLHQLLRARRNQGSGLESFGRTMTDSATALAPTRRHS